MMGRPVGYRQPGKHCPYCGSVKSAWERDPRQSVVDLARMTYVGECHFEPEDTVIHYDRRGIGFQKPDLRSIGWECSNCGRSMMGGDGGWFDVETGEPQFSFCPFCGWRVDAEATMRVATSSLEVE